MSGKHVGSEITSGEVEESVPDSSLPPGEGRVASRTTRDVVYLPEGSADGSAYHTSRVCPEFPGAGEVLGRAAAEDAGHPFCWTCFELEMQALAQD